MKQVTSNDESVIKKKRTGERNDESDRNRKIYCQMPQGAESDAGTAGGLNITDRAVSKWETGKCMPDSSIMLELCGILGITVNELLSREEMEMGKNDGAYEKKADENLLILKRRDENNINRNVVISIIFSCTLLIGAFVCVICDLAITGRLTWSLIPVSSILFAWVILFPVMIFGKKGILGGCISVSIFIFPYLYILSSLLHVRAVLAIGGAAAAISVVYLWLSVGIFRKFSGRKLTAAGIVFLAAVPFLFVMNGALSFLISEPMLDGWDVLTVFLLLIAAFTFFACDYARHKPFK